VLFVSGAAFSGGTTTTVAELMDFNVQTGELWAYPQGQSLATFIHTQTTQHPLAQLSTFLPPDPCLPLARAWNFTAQFDARFSRQSPRVFETLLNAMSTFRCHAQVTSIHFLSLSSPIVSVVPVAK
jgi:hypothetical protein